MEIRSNILLISIYSIFTVMLVADCKSSGLRWKRQNKQAQDKRIVCYYAFWAARRPGEFKFVPSDIDPTLCTHIMYGYARLEVNEGLVAYDYQVDIQNGGWASMIQLKSVNPEAKILLSVGGLFEGSVRFTKMAADIKLRETFVKSASKILKDNGFDGLDMSWLYPGFSQGSSAADKANYVVLMKELKKELGNEFILSMTVPALIPYIDVGYDVPELLKYTDYMNVLAYSYHDSTDATVNHHGPLYALPNDPGNKDANVDTTIREYLKRGAQPNQLNLVIPMYGVAFVLEDPEENDIGANTEDEAIGLEEPGALIYFELCQRIKNESWTVKRVNTTAMGPYAYKDRLWVAYDDETMVKNKAKYALEKGLGGLGFWTVDQDDFRGRCSLETFPLLRAGRGIFLGVESSDQQPQEISTTTLRQTTLKPTFATTVSSDKKPVDSSVGSMSETLSTSSRQTTIRPTFATTVSSDKKPVDSSVGAMSETLSTSSRQTTIRPTFTTTVSPSSKLAPPTYQVGNALSEKENRRPLHSWMTNQGDIFMKPGFAGEGHVIFRSNRDIVFSDFKIWIENHHHAVPRKETFGTPFSK